MWGEMLPIMGRTWGLTALLGLLGGLLGYGIDLALGISGWAAVGASLGLCGGAVFAGSLAAAEQPAIPAAEPSGLEPSAGESSSPHAPAAPE